MGSIGFVKISALRNIKDSLHRASEGIVDIHIALSSSHDQNCVYSFVETVLFQNASV